MARILIGWELGAGSGHSSRMLDLAGLLAERGHVPLFAPQQIGPFAAHGPTWQAPVWPRLLEPLSRRFDRSPSTMGDMLAYLGLDDEEAMAAMLMAWDRVLADTRPDAVVAEYAPILLLAARGRLPVVSWGTGFSLPPDRLPRFPSFIGEAPVLDEDALLAGLNQALRSAARPPLGALPQIFVADRTHVAVFRELDPYSQWRESTAGAPSIRGVVPEASDDGDELFVYYNGATRRPNALWQALANSRLPVRVYDPRITEAGAAALEGVGIKVERHPVPFADIAKRSRLLLSHGGLGFVCSGLLAGVPQVIIPFDAEKRLNADSLAARGLGLRASFDGLEADAFAAFMLDAWSDAGLRDRVRAAAPGFRARMAKTAEEEVAEMVEELF